MRTISIETEVIGYPELAAILNRSIPSLHRDDSAGRLPQGIRLGRSRKWLRSEITSWMQHGCPNRTSWAAMQARERRIGP